jgi:ribosomal protein L16/L10AE
MELNEGECGLKVLEGGYISSRQLEAGRKVIMRETKRLGKV